MVSDNNPMQSNQHDSSMVDYDYLFVFVVDVHDVFLMISVDYFDDRMNVVEPKYVGDERKKNVNNYELKIKYKYWNE